MGTCMVLFFYRTPGYRAQLANRLTFIIGGLNRNSER
jgi:hypothetical protein